MANLEEARDRLVQEKEELEEQLVNMEAAIKALTVNRDELANEKDSLLGTVVDLEEERANLRSSMVDLERVKGELLEEKKCFEEKLTEAARRCDDLQETRSDLEEKFSNLEQQHVSSLQINVRVYIHHMLWCTHSDAVFIVNDIFIIQEDEMNSLKEELNETQVHGCAHACTYTYTRRWIHTHIHTSTHAYLQTHTRMHARTQCLAIYIHVHDMFFIRMQCKLQEKQTEHDSTLKLSKELQSALDDRNVGIH